MELVKRINPSFRWFSALALVGVLLAAAIVPVAAQAGEITLADASLRLWPEYDDPGLLVIFSGTLAESVTVPAQVAFPIPANARGIQAAYVDSQGSLLSQDWQVVENRLTYSLPTSGFHVEYYVDREGSAPLRAISYTLDVPYAINSLSIDVQQPGRSTDLQIVPAPDSSFQGQDGFTYLRISHGQAAAGTKIPISIGYSKSDDGLSVSGVPQTAGATPAADALAPEQAGAATTPAAAVPVPAQPGATAAPEKSSGIPVLVWVLIGIALCALLAAGGYWYLQQSKTRGRSLPGKQQPAGPRGQRSEGAGPQFCHRCGRRYGSADLFCGKCGAPRRQG